MLKSTSLVSSHLDNSVCRRTIFYSAHEDQGPEHTAFLCCSAVLSAADNIFILNFLLAAVDQSLLIDNFLTFTTVFLFYFNILYFFNVSDKKLFTPGPLGVSMTVKEAMLRDLGSRDVEFINLVKLIRSRLVQIAGTNLA